MVIHKDEIISLIKKQIEKYETRIELKEIGYVLQISDGVAIIQGLDEVLMGELLEFPNNLYGMVMNLERDTVSCILFGEENLVHEGDIVKRTGRIMEVPVGEGLLGRVIDPLVRPLDGKGPIRFSEYRPVEVIAPGVVERMPVREPLQTGYKTIDSMIPIGRGQRELIIGDRQTGKTTIAIDTIISQRNEPKRPICIYVSIGQKQSSIAQIVKILNDNNAFDYTIILNASASSPASLQYIAPYVGCAIGEYFLWKGKDVLCIYDDLTKHAQAYRQLSLLLRRPPGREAYPGDIFYLHSRLLERACKLNEKNGGGSLTALPIVETQAGDISAYIPTNIISITDGQIYLETGLFHSGIKPAINVGLSVSRVGGSAQRKAMRYVAGGLRLSLAQYRELSSFAQFAGDLDKTSQAQLARGERMVELLKQEQHLPIPFEKQVVSLYAGVNGFMDDIPVHSIREFEKFLLTFVDSKYSDVLEKIRITGILSDEIIQKLDIYIKECKDEFLKNIKT